jgi:dipeptidase D
MELKNLEPRLLWSYFHQITQIPRPSKKEERILSYLKEFASSHQLPVEQDAAGNLVIRKPSTAGHDARPTVILQSHVDMVCEKNADTLFNFDTDPIPVYIDGDWVKARGTTLGADNGIGMAMMLSVLASNDLQHPAIECLFTVDEETGLTGAFALKPDLLKGTVLINLDSEDDGEVFIGCAGGIGTKGYYDYQPTARPDGLFGFKVTVSGLKGGHSGGDIHLGLANALKLLAVYLGRIKNKMPVRLAQLQGGNLHNAIPREATALVGVPYGEKETIRVLLNIYLAELETRYQELEPGLKISLESVELPSMLIDKKTSDNLIDALTDCPHGVIAMSSDMPGLVETSTNLASVKQKESNRIEIVTSQRSMGEATKAEIASIVKQALVNNGALVEQGDGYPGWKPNLSSPVLEVSRTAYTRLFGEAPAIKAIHAGLECGLFLEKYPSLDMVSIGPQMHGVHSPDERLSIRSTQKSWAWLVEILKNI